MDQPEKDKIKTSAKDYMTAKGYHFEFETSVVDQFLEFYYGLYGSISVLYFEHSSKPSVFVAINHDIGNNTHYFQECDKSSL